VTSSAAPSTGIPSQSIPGTDPGAPPAAQPTQANPLDPVIASHLREQYGVDPSQFQSPQQIIDYFGQAAYAAQHAVQLLPQYEQQIAALQQQLYAGASPQGASLNAASPAGAASPQLPAGPQKAWNPPEFDAEWMNHVRYDRESGAYVPNAPGTVDPSIIQKINARANYQQKFQRDFMNNPEETMWKILEQRLEERLNSNQSQAIQQAIQHFEQQQYTQASQQTLNQVIETNREWLYARDAQNQPLIAANGSPMLSADGMAYAKAVRELVDAGIPEHDTPRLNALALRMIGRNTKAAVPTPQDRAAAFAAVPPNGLAQALHTPSQNGASVPSAAGTLAPSPNPQSPWAIAQALMAKQGISTNGISQLTPLA
jgi:hypothetical protein